MTYPHPLIAFCGYARCGKDEAAKTLVAAGYARVCFGDIIKRQLDALILEHFGFSAFTTDTVEKAKIRRTLESWGDDNWDHIFREFFDTLPSLAVNTRLCRIREAEEWKRRGGILIYVSRPGVGPETPWAETSLRELHASGLITSTIINSGTVEGLHTLMRGQYLS